MGGWREFVFRIAGAVYWIAFAGFFTDSLLHEPEAQESTARRAMWGIAAVLSVLVALGIALTAFWPRLRLREWIVRCHVPWRDWLGVALLCFVGIGLYVPMELGYVDVDPPWLRFLFLYSLCVFILWVGLSYRGKH